jgi:hypothetical protein
MKSPSTLHVMPAASRNTTRLMSFMETMDFTRQQRFLVYGNKVDRVQFSVTDFDIEFVGDNFLNFLKTSRRFFLVEKIIIHGFFSLHLMLFFWFFPKLLGKVYWVVWGGDLYSIFESAGSKKSMIKRILKNSVLKRINNIVTYIPGDFLLVKKFLNPGARLHTSLMYPGNLYKDFSQYILDDDFPEIRILVGNSGSLSNNHIRIFEKLKKNRKLSNVKVFCPLSYGDADYINNVCNYGWEYFGENFVPLTEYMDLKDYVRFLSTMKYAVFDYDRQQGMGNIISLLGLGKGVFLNPQTTPWDFFKGKNVEIIDVNDLEGFDFTEKFISDNPSKIREIFSSQVLEKQLYQIFD